MAEQAVSNTVEYNKIHALALARRAVVQKFGTTLAHLWPMADDSAFIRDLMRQRPLYGKDIEIRASGMVDYAIKTASGHLSDVVGDEGGTTYSLDYLASCPTNYYYAVPIPEGRWSGLKFRSESESGITGAVVVAAPSTDPSGVAAAGLLSLDSTKETGTYKVENTGGGQNMWFYAGGPSRGGQRITLTMKLTRVVFSVKKVIYTTGPTGTVRCKVYDSSDTLLATASESYTQTSIGASFTELTFNFSTPVDLNNVDVRVVLELSNATGDVYDRFEAQCSSTDVISGVRTSYNGTWSDNGSYDAWVKLYGELALHSVDFPFPLDAADGQWWAYFKAQTCRDTDSGTSRGMAGKSWGGSSWSDLSDVLVEFQGVGARSWASCPKFSAAAIVNVDESPCDGTLVALSDGTEAKVRLRVKSDKKVEATVKNTNGTTYTLTSTEILHPGYNLVVVSYEQNVAAKLIVNGIVVDTETPSDYPLFATAGNTLDLAVGVGARVLADKTVDDQLKDAFVDDVLIAKGVMADSHWQDIYMHYITAAPLMQVSDVSITQVAE